MSKDQLFSVIKKGLSLGMENYGEIDHGVKTKMTILMQTPMNTTITSVISKSISTPISLTINMIDLDLPIYLWQMVNHSPPNSSDISQTLHYDIQIILMLHSPF